MKAVRRSTFILLILGESISTGGLFYSLLGYFAQRVYVSSVVALAPLERDHVAEAVAPLVSAQPKGESALSLVRGRFEEIRLLYKGWHELAQLTLNTRLIQCFMWGGVLLVILALHMTLRRPHASSDPAL